MLIQVKSGYFWLIQVMLLYVSLGQVRYGYLG